MIIDNIGMLSSADVDESPSGTCLLTHFRDAVGGRADARPSRIRGDARRHSETAEHFEGKDSNT